MTHRCVWCAGAGARCASAARVRTEGCESLPPTNPPLSPSSPNLTIWRSSPRHLRHTLQEVTQIRISCHMGCGRKGGPGGKPGTVRKALKMLFGALHLTKPCNEVVLHWKFLGGIQGLLREAPAGCCRRLHKWLHIRFCRPSASTCAHALARTSTHTHTHQGERTSTLLFNHNAPLVIPDLARVSFLVHSKRTQTKNMSVQANHLNSPFSTL